MFTFTKVEPTTKKEGVMIIATNPNHEVPDDIKFQTVNSLVDIDWRKESLCATVYLMSGPQVQALARTDGVLLPVSGFLCLDDDLVMYANGLASPITAAELSIILADVSSNVESTLSDPLDEEVDNG